MIVASHKLFSKSKDLYKIIFSLTGEYVTKIKPALFFETQFYAVIIPYVFSLGLVVLAFVIGKMFFSDNVGLYAAAIMAINPISIMTSQKIWADDMLSFFVGLSFLLYALGIRHRKDYLYFLAGLSCGVGVLAKQTGGYLCFALLYFIVLVEAPKKSLRDFLAGLFARKYLYFVLGVALVTAFWFWEVYRTYGDPLFLPWQKDLPGQDITGWFQHLSSRPSSYIMFSVVTIYFCPFFAFSLLSLKDFALDLYWTLRGQSKIGRASCRERV